MPKTRFQEIIFTLLTAVMMVYIMTLYNTVLAMKDFTNNTFLIALKEMWTEFFIITLCAYFISTNAAKHFAFRIVKEDDRPIFIIFAIQIFTVVFQVALASIIGTIKGYGITTQFLPDYLMTYCRNFPMALLIQLFLVGPLARKIFRSIFLRKEKSSSGSANEIPVRI